jgi:AhpD family alkylhydroperoxidase
MTPIEARITPLGDGDPLDAELDRALGALPKVDAKSNLIRTFARVPTALKAYLPWMDFIVTKNSLPHREREIVTIRIAFLTQCPYERAHHVRSSRAVGVTPDEFRRIETGAEAGWNAADAALIRACDDLLTDHRVSDEVWQTLMENFSQEQVMDVVMTAAQYAQLAMIINSFGVQVEPRTSDAVAELERGDDNSGKR